MRSTKIPSPIGRYFSSRCFFNKMRRTISSNLYEIYFISNNRKSLSLSRNQIYILFYNFAFLILLKTSLQSSRDSCHISRSTVQIVEDCPNSEEQWKQAAMRKNCAAYASQCSKPERLEYHCVINPFMNQTLEVCAYAQNIVLGKFSFTIDLIQIGTNLEIYVVIILKPYIVWKVTQ